MNHNLERSPNATVGAAPTPEVTPFTIEPIQGWFRRLNNGQGLRPRGMASTCLEQRLCGVGDEFTHGGAGLRILVMGQPKALKPEVEYQRRQLRVVVRDNGRGIDPQALRSEQDTHWGLLGMRERAGAIGAQLRIWSRRGAGTEVEITVPTGIAADAPAYSLKSPTLQNEAVA